MGPHLTEDPELLELRVAFEAEGAELLLEIEAALLALSARPDDVTEFSRLFRAVHTIKGSAGIVGLQPLEWFCHRVEHLLVRVREGEVPLEPSLVAFLLACHDHVRAQISAFATPGGQPPDVPASLEDQLTHWASWPAAEPGAADDTVVLEVPQSGEEPSAASAAAGVPGQRSVRVDAVRLDQLADLVTELVTANSNLEAEVRRLGDSRCIESSAQVSSLVKKLQEKAMVFRMVPVKSLLRRFHRIVHDEGLALGKEIQLVTAGEETELDKAVAEKLHDPMLHLVRNAIDHGIETSAERVARGKPAQGTIHIQATDALGSIVITITDDGKGMDLEAITRKARRAGLLPPDEAPSEHEILDCIFRPGFSTLDEATRLSGRGVGLDVVRKALEALRGHLEVATTAGEGTTFTLRIPLCLSLIDGFLLGVGDTLFIVQLEQVLEVREYPEVSEPGTLVNGCLRVREHVLPCIDLAVVLGIPRDRTRQRCIVIMRCDGHSLALVVDRVLGEIKSIVKPLGPLLRGSTCVSGASILGDGSLALFLETEKLIARLS